ncbi:hypothetical protein ABBQ38_008032 [Trebouxia sp. C0009 RCD-2024]
MTAYDFRALSAVCHVLELICHVLQGSPLDEISKHGNSLRTSFENTTSKISPVAFVDGQTRTFLKGKLRENQALIWRSCVEASIYCALFHEIKRVLKNRTANHRRMGSVVKYMSDVMLPDGLFGPIIGFVIRLKFFT